MNRPALTNGLLTAALVACGLLVAALVYGLATRALAPAPPRAEAAAPDSVRTARALAAAHARISVEIRNGTGVNGLAARTRTLLREDGFDVLEVGSAKERADTTVVTVRNGTRADAQTVAEALGLPPRRIVGDSARNENAATVSLTLGHDYRAFARIRDAR